MDDQAVEPPWLAELLAEVQMVVDQQHESHGDRRPALMKELVDLQRDIDGFVKSYADSSLTSAIRKLINDQLTEAMEKQNSIENDLRTIDALAAQVRQLIDKKAILKRLERLPNVLASGNITEGNAELSLHIDKILCHPDGSVIVRTCKLGVLAGICDLLTADFEPLDNSSADNDKAAIPRRRSPLRMDDRATADFAVDVDRYAGFDDRWFHEDVFQIPPPAPSWAESAADDVAAHRAKGMTHAELAEHFGVTPPTIRNALKFAKAKNPELAALPRKMPRDRWEEQNFAAVATAKHEHPEWKMKDFVQHFGKCEVLISRALKLAKEAAKGEGDKPIDDSSGDLKVS